MKKFLIITLLSSLIMQSCVQAVPENIVTNVIVTNNGRTEQQARTERRSAHIFDAVHGTLVGITLCGVTHITKSAKLGLIVAGLHMYAVANQQGNRDSFICQYGRSIGVMTVAFTSVYALRNIVLGIRYR